jgi:fructose-1,6-bisphosphatase I
VELKEPLSLSRFILEHERQWGVDHTMAELLLQIGFASKTIYREVNRAGLVQILGLAGLTNVQDEDVQKLDVYANRVFFDALDHTGLICAMASEEEEGVMDIPHKYPKGPYVVLFDPLDGSSNIDANISIGTIFAIYRRISQHGTPGTMPDCLQKGSELAAAGYVIYGSSCMLVMSVGTGVHGFTLDTSLGEFLLSHENIKIPEKAKCYSANESNYAYWNKPIQDFTDYIKRPNKEKGFPLTSRYIGSLVADFHRNLLYGGIFMYPRDNKSTKYPNGKLRLLYEEIPLAFIAGQADGYASNGEEPILDIQPKELHERQPFFVGNKREVELAEAFLREEYPDDFRK